MKNLIPVLLLTWTVNAVHAQTTITLQPDAAVGEDAILHGLPDEADNNYGDNAQFAADAWTFSGNPGVVRSIINFDLSAIPAGSTIISAELSLYAWDTNTAFGQHSTLSGPNDCWLQRVTSSWNESTVDWNTQPTTTATNQVSLPASVSATQDYLSIDIAAMIQDMVDNPGTSFGFMLRLQDETYYRRMNFASSDHPNAALHPKLVICYSLDSTAAVSENTFDNVFSVYPNPAKEEIFIRTNSQGFENTPLEIFNSQGQLLISTTVTQLITAVDISSLAAGIYFICIPGNDEKAAHKFIVE
jgi:hypothetical protein